MTEFIKLIFLLFFSCFSLAGYHTHLFLLDKLAGDIMNTGIATYDYSAQHLRIGFNYIVCMYSRPRQTSLGLEHICLTHALSHV